MQVLLPTDLWRPIGVGLFAPNGNCESHSMRLIVLWFGSLLIELCRSTSGSAANAAYHNKIICVRRMGLLQVVCAVGNACVVGRGTVKRV